MFISKKEFLANIKILEERVTNQGSVINDLRHEKEIFDKQIENVSVKVVALIDSNKILEKQIYDVTETVKDCDGKVNTRIDGLISEVESLSALLAHRVAEFNEALTMLNHEKAISDKQVDLLTKIVCHLSGAKAYDGKRDFSFDEISRRLAKLEDINNG